MFVRIVSSACVSSVVDISAKQNSMMEQLQNLRIVEVNDDQDEAQSEDPASLRTASRPMAARTTNLSPSSRDATDKTFTSRARYLCKNTGSRVTSSVVLNVHWNDLRSTYTVSGTLRMPSVLAGYALTVRARLDLFKLSWPSISPTVGIRNIVPDNSEFMLACRAGNLAKVKELALARQGSPTDIDESGYPAIHVSSN